MPRVDFIINWNPTLDIAAGFSIDRQIVRINAWIYADADPEEIAAAIRANNDDIYSHLAPISQYHLRANDSSLNP